MDYYFTEEGLKVPAVSKDKMIEIDRLAIEDYGPNLYQMMENAGRNLAQITLKSLGSKWKSSKIIVLAGTGSNGGGGICCARHLTNHGADVKVCVTEPGNMKEVSDFQMHILQATNADIISINQLQNEKPDIIIDSILGYNLNGEPYGNALEFINWASKNMGIIISLDVPSGIDSATGAAYSSYIKPDLTLTLALPKTCLLTALTGELFLADIGIPLQVFLNAGINYHQPFEGKSIIKLISKCF